MGMFVYVFVDGVVIMVDDFYYLGNILIFDYGMCVFLMFFYMDIIMVEVGEIVK